MKSLHNVFHVIVLTSLLAGCGGTKFVREKDTSLVLGKTTEQDIRSRMGKPDSEGEWTENPYHFNSLLYAYYSASGQTSSYKVLPMRQQEFFFYKNKLVGHRFSSTWVTEHTDFDESEIARLKENISTRRDVIRIMGIPSGRNIYPLSKYKGGETLVYYYAKIVRGSLTSQKYVSKELLVALNDKGIVSEINYKKW